MLNYEELKQQKIKLNLKDVQKHYNKKKSYIIKIDKFCKKYQISKDQVIRRIKEGDKITLSIFIMDPTKQNFYEKTAMTYIKNIKGISNFQKLPHSGNNALYVEKDSIRKRKTYEGDLPSSKTIDFTWFYGFKNVRYYAFHKYIKESGGAQDNQYYDVLKSIKVAKSLKINKQHKILFICDGQYFLKKKEILKKEVNNENHFVISIDDLKKILKNTSN